MSKLLIVVIRGLVLCFINIKLKRKVIAARHKVHRSCATVLQILFVEKSDNHTIIHVLYNITDLILTPTIIGVHDKQV